VVFVPVPQSNIHHLSLVHQLIPPPMEMKKWETWVRVYVVVMTNHPYGFVSRSQGTATQVDRDNRIKLIQDLYKFDNLEALDLVQKAHIKWDIEGGENSKFFYGMINQKRRTQEISCIMHDGVWISDPLLIKEIFLNFFKEKFQAYDSQVAFSPLACGSNKAPGPDGFSFAFIKKYWDLLKTDIFDFVNSFFESGSMPQGANSSFFKLIPKIITKVPANWLSKVIDTIVNNEQSAFISGRQILDGPLILSERSSIKACLHSSRASFLINGSPTSEGSDLENIIRVLHVSSLASGLKINIHKSNIYGIGVPNEEVSIMARNSGCALGSFAFTVGDCTLFQILFGLKSLKPLPGKEGALDSQGYCLIIDQIKNGQWKWNWNRANIGVRKTAFLRDLLSEISLVDLNVEEDSSVWSLAKYGIFTVGETRRIIDAQLLPSLVPPTSRDKVLPRKVNTFL
nr:RNA-directed DNA polymerase, eukaryota, reverse transcriptase zinc-binding domain protein [Tanacetum cinerariifolium]